MEPPDAQVNRTRSGRSRSPLIAALASAIIPGAGHLYAGYRRTGWLLIAFSLLSMLPAILLAAALFVTSDIGIAITVAEVGVGLSLFLLAERIRKTTRTDDLSLLKG